MILTVGSCLLEGEPELKHSSLNEPGEHVPSTQFRPVICRMRCQSTRKQSVKFAISGVLCAGTFVFTFYVSQNLRAVSDFCIYSSSISYI